MKLLLASDLHCDPNLAREISINQAHLNSRYTVAPSSEKPEAIDRMKKDSKWQHLCSLMTSVARARAELGWQACELNTTHDAMVTAPQELAQILLNLV
jgi:hypothetical protein